MTFHAVYPEKHKHIASITALRAAMEEFIKSQPLAVREGLAHLSAHWSCLGGNSFTVKVWESTGGNRSL
uniref:Uncharacterized protein n=1 Tax=viral metagenome TaxID=1070528 RepID=A0A6M3KYH3_9ZZZZ